MALASFALGFGLSLLPGNVSTALAAPESEVEEMQRIVQERTGKMPPHVNAAPPVIDDLAKPQKRLRSEQLGDFTRELR